MERVTLLALDRARHHNYGRVTVTHGDGVQRLVSSCGQGRRFIHADTTSASICAEQARVRLLAKAADFTSAGLLPST